MTDDADDSLPREIKAKDGKTMLEALKEERLTTEEAAAPTPAVAEEKAPGELSPDEFRFLKRIEMSVSNWIPIPDNPRQRDTERHAAGAVHLRKLDPTHASVTMAVLPDGSRYKIDGHTRALLWQRGELDKPERLRVDIYSCNTVETVEKAYNRFDNSSAVETSADQALGACRSVGINLQSPLMRRGAFSAALKRVFMLGWGWQVNWKKSEVIYKAVARLKTEIIALDALMPQPKVFASGVMMAFIVSYRADGEDCLPFWDELNIGAGEKLKSGAMDAVEALSRTIDMGKKRRVDGTVQQQHLFNYSLTAYDLWKKGVMVTASSNAPTGLHMVPGGKHNARVRKMINPERIVAGDEA